MDQGLITPPTDTSSGKVDLYGTPVVEAAAVPMAAPPLAADASPHKLNLSLPPSTPHNGAHAPSPHDRFVNAFANAASPASPLKISVNVENASGADRPMVPSEIGTTLATGTVPLSTSPASMARDQLHQPSTAPEMRPMTVPQAHALAATGATGSAGNRASSGRVAGAIVATALDLKPTSRVSLRNDFSNNAAYNPPSSQSPNGNWNVRLSHNVKVSYNVSF